MTIREFIEMCSTLPDVVLDKEIMFYDTENGQATTPRTDVSQFNLYRDGVQIFTKPHTPWEKDYAATVADETYGIGWLYE